MGTEYYLINSENKTFYELGKGGWAELSDDIDAVTDAEYLADTILEEVFYRSGNASPTTEHISYANEISKEIVEFCKCDDIKNIHLINDCTDCLTAIKYLGYKCIGSRYREDNNPKYNQDAIDINNKHLTVYAKMYQGYNNTIIHCIFYGPVDLQEGK